MTPIREQFEDWGRTYYLNLIRTRGGQYRDVLAEAAYAAWRARDAEVQQLRQALTEVTNELEAEVNHRYGFDPATGEVKGLARRYEVDISVVRMARAVLAGEEATDE